jgi:hypothetical protein
MVGDWNSKKVDEERYTTVQAFAAHVSGMGLLLSVPFV